MAARMPFLVSLLFLLLFGCIGGGDMSPASATATPAAGGIEITWGPAQGAAGYNIYRSTDAAAQGEKINPSLLVGVTSYKDTGVSDGVTYYYTVKAVDSSGAEHGAKQASATARVAPPGGLGIMINGGNNFTSDRGVSLSLTATGASQCRFSNDGATWSDWEAFAASRTWMLTQGDGLKTLYFQCKDSLGNTAQPASASIRLSTVPPTISVVSPVDGAHYTGAFQLAFSVASPVANQLNCTGKLDGQVIEVGIADAGVAYNFTIPASPGQHTMYGECSDGFLSSNRSATFTIIDKPSVELAVGDGSGYTDRTDVYLTVNATLATACRFSNDAIHWNTWAPYYARVSWVLTSGEGTKTVYAQCRSESGQVSDTASDSIILDTSPPPYISISINNGARRVNSRDVTLGLYAFAGYQCKFSNDNPYSWTNLEPYATRKAWTLSPGDGTKYVYYDCKKLNGDDVGTASAQVYLYQIAPGPPANLDIEINGGSSTTQSRNVELTLSAERASECRFSEDQYSWTGWEDYASRRDFTMSSGDGLKTVYYQCRNDYGQKMAYSTIYLQADPPSGLSMSINDGSGYAGSRDVTLRLSAYRATDCRYMEEGSSWTGWESYATSRGFTLSDGDGLKTLHYQCRNRAGTADANPARVTLDTTPPPPITDLSASGTLSSVSLTWSPPERGGTPIQEYRIFRSTADLGLITQIGTTRSTSYIDREVSEGNTYNYWVRSADVLGHVSADSNMASAQVGLVGPVTGP